MGKFVFGVILGLLILVGIDTFWWDSDGRIWLASLKSDGNKEKPRADYAVVDLLSPLEICQKILKNEKLVFVDTREKEEFESKHIPTAVNIPRALLDGASGLIPQDAEVIPYCKKDFRGFAAAQDLKRMGFKDIRVMSERGLIGWEKAGFPVAGQDALKTDEKALEELREFCRRNKNLPQTSPIPTTNLQTGKLKEIEVLAKNWDFIPNLWSVNLGDRVKVKIKSVEGFHGLSIPDYNLNLDLEPGKDYEFEFVADKQGEFLFGCSVFCGAGHGTMSGKLLVE